MLSKYLSSLIDRASKLGKTIVLPEGEDERVLNAAYVAANNKVANIIILGDVAKIEEFFAAKGSKPENISIIDPQSSEKKEEYANLLFEIRKDKGMTIEEARQTVLNKTYFGTLMVKAKDADGMVSGAIHSTADTVRPALQIIKSARKDRGVSAFLIMVSNNEPYILSDAGLVINPDDKELAGIAISAAESAITFGIAPKIAMLSFSTKGSAKGPEVDKVVSATKIASELLKNEEYQDKGIEIDGELQVDAALDLSVGQRKAPGSHVAGKAKVLVVPNLDTGNICYKLLQRLGGCEAYGPILQGLNAPINDLSRGAFVEDIVGAIAITCIQAQK